MIRVTSEIPLPTDPNLQPEQTESRHTEFVSDNLEFHRQDTELTCNTTVSNLSVKDDAVLEKGSNEKQDQFRVGSIKTGQSEHEPMEVICKDGQVQKTKGDQMNKSLPTESNQGTKDPEIIPTPSFKDAGEDKNELDTKQHQCNIEHIEGGQSSYTSTEAETIDKNEKMELDQGKENQTSESDSSSKEAETFSKNNKMELEVINDNFSCESDSGSGFTDSKGEPLDVMSAKSLKESPKDLATSGFTGDKGEQLDVTSVESLNDLATSELYRGRHVQELRKSLSTIVEKFMSHIKFSKFREHLKPLYEQCPRDLKKLHRQFVQQLKNNINDEIEKMMAEENIVGLLNKLDELNGSKEENKITWRPSGDPTLDVLAHTMPVKLKEQTQLKKMLSDLETQNSLLKEALRVKQKRVLDTRQKIEKHFDDIRKVASVEIPTEEIKVFLKNNI
ncbi:hypothetical protein ScPMuIL_018213 [Solemya velum]